MSYELSNSYKLPFSFSFLITSDVNRPISLFFSTSFVVHILNFLKYFSPNKALNFK